MRRRHLIILLLCIVIPLQGFAQALLSATACPMMMQMPLSAAHDQMLHDHDQMLHDHDQMPGAMSTDGLLSDHCCQTADAAADAPAFCEMGPECSACSVFVTVLSSHATVMPRPTRQYPPPLPATSPSLQLAAVWRPPTR
ncbi:MAG: hypothetical protein RQ899_11345 [Pseudomonadales bacterium]|nr:hypothetical protein [Pseudomonadales bacterium]